MGMVSINENAELNDRDQQTMGATHFIDLAKKTVPNADVYVIYVMGMAFEDDDQVVARSWWFPVVRGRTQGPQYVMVTNGSRSNDWFLAHEFRSSMYGTNFRGQVNN